MIPKTLCESYVCANCAHQTLKELKVGRPAKVKAPISLRLPFCTLHRFNCIPNTYCKDFVKQIQGLEV